MARSFWGLPAMFWAIWVGVLALWVGRFVVPFLSIYLTENLDFTPSTVGIVLAAYGAGGIIASLVAGFLSDRFGRTPVILAGELGAAALILLIPIQDSPAGMTGALFAYGILGHVGGPALNALIVDLVPPTLRERAFSLNALAMNAGFAIGPVIAANLAAVAFWLVFVTQAAVLALTALLLAVVLIPRGVGRRTRVGRPPTMREGYKVVGRDTVFLMFVAAMIAYMTIYAQGTSTLPIAMTNAGFTVAQYSVLLTLNGVLLCVLQIPLIRVFERIASTPIITVGILLTAAGYMVQALAHTWEQYAVAVVLWTIGELGTFPVAAAVVANMAPARYRGLYQGLFGLVFTAGFAVGPLLGGIGLSVLGASTLWWLCALGLGLIAVVVFIVRRGRERRLAQPDLAEDDNFELVPVDASRTRES
ncbi:Predicted arabinose efflux permease, MFS family [Herbiconiux ginsengi]|uniref:Predicted arabinose efflux permease, MFS family n=1 Tax=Herbiconiux ginsengi TaxID=381665 RepID=A0A1H3TIN4_9MICO|nr:Predicted arabinose efflux permease, MFS family [Herbiconiux ginsengi]